MKLIGSYDYGISGIWNYWQDGNDIRISGGTIRVLDGRYAVCLNGYSYASKLTMTGGTIEAIHTNNDTPPYEKAIHVDYDQYKRMSIINILGGTVRSSYLRNR